jgi:integrase
MKIETEYRHTYEHNVTVGGKNYTYLRFMVGGRRVAMMPKPIGGAEFRAKHAELMAALEAGTLLPAAAEEAKPRAKRGTVAWVVERYLAHREYLDLADSTRDNYRRYAEHLASCKMGRFPFTKLCPEVLRAERNEIAAREPGKWTPGAPYVPAGTKTADNICRLMVRILWSFVGEHLGEHIKLGNRPCPADQVKIQHTKKKQKSHERVPEHMITRYLDGADFREKAALTLLLFTGQRECDVCKMAPADVSDTHVSVTQRKTGTKVVIKIMRQLREVLAELPKDGAILFRNKRGGAYTTDTLYRLVKKRLIAIGAGRFTAHGLRASAACRVFEATGGDIARTMAITGHTSEKTLRTYIADANRERLGDEAIDAVQIMLDRREAARAA